MADQKKLSHGVSVRTTARLHMGFFDLHGGLGRRFGSIGVSLDQPATQLHAWRADTFTVEGVSSDRALRLAKRMAAALNLQGGMHMQFAEVIPEHAGLGSGTQMALVVGMAMNKLYNLGLVLQDVAVMTDRGARSGIGLGTFAAGGVVIDGGRGSNTLVPPVIARADFPEQWRIVLIFDTADQGVHGEQEVNAFKQLPEFPAQDAALLCRHVLMQALPALAEHDLDTFGAAIRELQEKTGDYFAPVQGGRYASPRVSQVLAFLASQHVSCLGQSSWGPTGFAVFADEATAVAYINTLRARFAAEKNLIFQLCKGLNRGGILNDIA